MSWKDLPLALLVASAALFLIGLVLFFKPDAISTWDPIREPGVALHLLELGLAGAAFVAWLKR
jgi:hypothetical protein